MKKIIMVVGTRPNYMKLVPIYNSLVKMYKIYLIHTGQHHNDNLNYIFKKELKLPEYDFTLQLTSNARAGDLDNKLYKNNKDYLMNIDLIIQDLTTMTNLGQFGEIRDGLINIFNIIKPDLVMVFGDVTSTLSAAIACKILNYKLAHIESGLRSNDISMPEEVNRIIVDHITDYFFITEQSGYKNLIKEGKIKNLFIVGNPMISCLQFFFERIRKNKYYEELYLEPKKYILVTLHRPSNVDCEIKLKEIYSDLVKLSQKYKIIFPVHPRTRKNIEKINIKSNNNLILCEPLGYLKFINLLLYSMCVITDSGGIQEETSCLGIQCFTLRDNTERPSTLIENGGTNQLIKKITLDLDFNKQYNDRSFDEINVGEKILNILKTLI